MENKKYPCFIDTNPRGKDLFEGKSQEKIAKSIARHLQDNDSSSRLVGLEGQWGSGKSNIIKLLKQPLKETHHLYVYDAWGHQEDSQRRAFLEELTEDLIDDNLLSKKPHNGDKWTDKLKYLLARKKETNKRDVPKLGLGIVWMGLVVILTPILALLANSIGNEGDGVLLQLFFSISFLLISIVVGIVFTFWKRFFSEEKEWASLASLFQIYKGKSLESTTYETISELEPSVKEFKRWMKSLSEDLKKELIIVFDNMDRLPPEKIKGLWSSIHTFFAEEQYEKIWVIIPFDRDHLQEAFHKNNSEDGENNTDQFINKTFPILYRVSPPVLTDWKYFFENLYKEAFGETEENEFTSVVSIFDRLKLRFTPRDIIVFINELVTLKKVWAEQIPLRYIAIFTLKKNLILENPQEVILNNDYLEGAKSYFLNDDNLQNNIAALVYNVPIEKASQVTVLRDLELALRKEDGFEINNLAKHSHFLDILEEVIQNSELDPQKAIDAFSQLDISIIKSNNAKIRITNIWDEFTMKQVGAPFPKQEFSEEHKHLFVNATLEKKQLLLEYLTKNLRGIKDFSGSAYFNALDSIDHYIKEKSLDIDLDNYIDPVIVEPGIFWDYLSVAKSNYLRYKISSNPDKLNDFIVEKIPNEFPKESLLTYLSKDNLYSFTSLKESIEDGNSRRSSYNKKYQ